MQTLPLKQPKQTHQSGASNCPDSYDLIESCSALVLTALSEHRLVFRKSGKLRRLHLEKVKLVAEGQHRSYHSKMMEEISTWESYDVELEKSPSAKILLAAHEKPQTCSSTVICSSMGNTQTSMELCRGGTWDREGRQSQIPKMLHGNTSSGSSAFLMQKMFPPTDAGHSTHPRKKDKQALHPPHSSLRALSPLRNLSSHDESLFIFVG